MRGGHIVYVNANWLAESWVNENFGWKESNITEAAKLDYYNDNKNILVTYEK